MKFLTDIVAIFRTPTAEAIAKSHLEDAQRSLLKHQDAAEFHDAMVVYLETKIARLEKADIQVRLSQIDPADLQGFPSLRKAA